jgi:retron-type reverse transcriptase
MLKINSNYIISPLTHICNKIILSGSFHDRLKYSIVRAVYKKGDRTNYSNYRPISLLTSFSKIFEKAIYIRITEYLINNKILSDGQYGFRKGLATENAISKLINEILNNQNNKTKTGSVFCDLQKAFDTVNHALLLN